MAGLLLSGSVFAAHQAGVDWTTGVPGALDNAGKYWQLNYLNYRQGSGDWTTGGTGFYLTITEGSVPQLVIANTASDLLDKTSYWTLKEIPLTAGETYPDANCVALVEIVNAEGYTLSLDKSTGLLADDNTVASDKISRFYVRKGTNNNIVLAYYPSGNSSVYCIGQDVTIDANTIALKGKLLGTDNYGVSWNLKEIAEEVISATDLNAQLKDGFGLLFGPGKDKEYKNLTGAEAFSGKITAEPISGASDKYYFKRADGKYIVLSDDFIGEANATLDGTEDAIYRGYNFKAVSKHTFDTEINKNNAIFTVYKSYDFNDTDSLIVTLPYAGMDKQLGSLPTEGLNQTDACPGLRVFVASSKNDDFLTTIEYKKANDRLATQNHNDYDFAQFGALAPYIQFGMNNMVDIEKFAGQVWNITDTNGNILMPNVEWDNIDKFTEGFAPAAQVQLNKPEGHWLAYKNSDTDYGFINRESGIKWNLAGNGGWVIRHHSDNTYGVYSSKYVTGSADEYTVNITPVADAELGWTEMGYARYDEAKEALNGKYISLQTSLGVTAYIGKDADDNVVLTTDKSKAIEFRVKDLKHDYTSHDGKAGIDTLQHVTTFIDIDKDGNYVYDAKDTLQFYHYRLFEHFSEKYLTYNPTTQKFVLETLTPTDNNAHEDFNKYFNKEGDKGSAFVLKEKNGQYNLISNYDVQYDECTVTGGVHTEGVVDQYDEYDNDMYANLYGAWANEEHTSVYLARKMYAASQTATIADMAGIYNYNDNDRFTVEDIATPEYMTVTMSQDTVKIALQAKSNFFLYEQGKNGTNFLGMDHVADVEDMKAAILADTAYVRYNTYKPQYLLAVGTTIRPEIPCDIPGHPTLHPDTVYGRFLVNMVDSAKTYGLDKKSNPYIWEELNGIPYYRLAFIDGYHTGDALTLNTAGGKKKIALNNNNDKVCTFAFRYVDEERKGVKIETAYGSADANGNRSRGWLKYQNNVPVVTPDYEDAHVFTVDNTTTDAPTANETIAAGNVVVAGTNGAVVVKGAEGKNVIVSTILGKVVANEVVSSDNAQIATPAGIVVVSVDGESFKVVVK